MSGAGRRTPREGQRGSDHLRIPAPGTGPPSIDALYRRAHTRDEFHRLVATYWPTPTRKARTP